MSVPSSRTHLFRLGIVLVFALIGFVVVKTIATPASWNYEEWYREDALKEIASYPLVYGGNESCQTCHAEEHKELPAFKHRTVSCETCHGAVADHVRDGRKIAAAKVDDESNWQCLNCHQTLVTRRAGFPQFSTDRFPEHKQVAKGMLCAACHNAHDPTL